MGHAAPGSGRWRARAALAALARRLVLLGALAGCSGGAAAQPVDAEAEVDAARIAQALGPREDTDTLLGLSAEGALLYTQDRVKLTGYDYCGQAVAQAERGEFRSGARAAAKALHLAEAGQDPELLAYARRDLAIVFSYAGQLDKAVAFARAALQGGPWREPTQVVGPAWKVIGDVQLRRRDPAAAIDSYERALAGSSPRFAPLVRAALANAQADAGRLDQAQATLAGVGAALQDPSLRAQVRRTEARLLLAAGRPAEALQRYQALAAARGGPDGAYFRVWALDGVAAAQLALGRRAEAAAALGEAIDALDGVRARFRSDEIKIGLFSDLQALYERAIVLAAEAGDAVGAFALSDRSRARALLDSVRGRVEGPAAAGVAALAGVPAAGTAAGKPAVPTPVARLRALQAALADDERLLQFHVLPDRVLAWVVGRDKFRSTSIQVGRDELGRQVDAWRDDIVNGRRKAYTGADRLDALLLAPLGLAEGQRLILVPHGPLHYLPFQALRRDGRFAIERHPVAVVPSVSVAAQLAARGRRLDPDLVAFGNPQIEPKLDLPGAEAEVGRLVTLFPGARAFLRAEANESVFRQRAGEGRIVHVAAHAEADVVDPLHSRILLASEGGQRNFLEAHEVMQLDLGRVALVTLSACESALGRVAAGDEVLGFPRSFLAAGAGGLIASLWPVSDESTEVLMTALYGELARGVDLQRALQAGQLAVLRQPQQRHPFFWAPFNLIGNWRMAVPGAGG